MNDEITRRRVKILRAAISRRNALGYLGGALGAAVLPGVGQAAA
jgi:hypothetical protein